MTSRAIRPISNACAAGALCVALVACGASASKSGTALTTSGYTQQLKFVDCMRSHGVPNMPDPSPNPPSGSYSSVGGIVIPPSINMQSPAFKTAEQACQKLLPSGGAPGPSTSGSEKLQLLALAKCMRSHGVPNFPDPTSSPLTGTGDMMGGNGAYLLFPAAGRQSPAFKQAAAVCEIR